MSVVRGRRVVGALVGCDERVVFVLSRVGAAGWFTGRLNTGFINLSRSWPDALKARTPKMAANTKNDGTNLKFVKTYFSFTAATRK